MKSPLPAAASVLRLFALLFSNRWVSQWEKRWARQQARPARSQGKPARQSEQRLAWQIMARAARWVIWIGDRNFGVWSVVAQAVRHDQDVLVRLTRSRARKLMGPAPLLSGQERRIQWSPSRQDQAAPGTEGLAVCGRLI